MKLKHLLIIAALTAASTSAFSQENGGEGGPPQGAFPQQGGPPQGGFPQGGFPQGGFRGPMGFGQMGGGLNLVMLVGQPDVQDDLQLTDDQKDKLEKLRETMLPQGGPGGGGPGGGPGGGGPGGGGPGGDGPGGGGPGGGGPGGPPPGGGGFGGPPPDGGPGGGGPGGGGPGGGGPGGGGPSDAMRKAFEETRKKATEELKKILTTDQYARLKGIGIQLGGNSVAADPEIQTDLALTDAQKAKIKTLQKKAGDAGRTLFDKVRNQELDPQELPGMMKQNRQILNDEIGKVLTPDQKTKLKTMSGKPFKSANVAGGG